MSYVNNILGNIYVRHLDKWRGYRYLKDDLTFTLNKNLAAKIYMLKSGNTTIINGDRVSLNLGNKILVITENNIIKFLDRDQLWDETDSFTITNGTDNTEPIMYDSTIFLITNKTEKYALKYEWILDLINSNTTTITEQLDYNPRSSPTLMNGDYTLSDDINAFQFQLEKIETTTITTNPDDNKNPTTKKQSPFDYVTKIFTTSLENYKGAIMLVLLMIILVLCFIANR
jgi:hypothetical protein